MEIQDFIKTYHPRIMKNYELHEKGWDVLKVGMKVRTLRAGFCGGAGEIRTLAELNEDKHGRCVILTGGDRGPDSRSILYENDNWWDSVELVE